MPATGQNLAPYARWPTSYTSDGRELAGFWLQPEGRGPFPAAVFNHGSDGLLPASMPGIRALQGMGYAIFLPIRRGHNDQPGTFWLDRVTAPWGSPDMGDQLVSALRAELRDVMAAVGWVAERPEVDCRRIVMLGSSFGGALTVLALGEDLPLGEESALRAGVSFAGPSMTWPHALSSAIGAELARLGRPHETRIYPAIGDGPGGGHGMFGTGVDLWRQDVESFLARSLTSSAAG